MPITSLARTSRLTARQVKTLPYKWSDPRKGPYVNVAYAFAERTGNGALGDARQGTREAGQAMIGTAVDRTVEFLNDFLSRD